jgi:hypothetical protein
MSGEEEMKLVFAKIRQAALTDVFLHSVNKE